MRLADGAHGSYFNLQKVKSIRAKVPRSFDVRNLSAREAGSGLDAGRRSAGAKETKRTECTGAQSQEGLKKGVSNINNFMWLMCFWFSIELL
ncbi:hypothetical protein GWI33_003805 [Rhynchophorus ferrugineus]|uniref:Uncharacterized protein n=1 Tax=Rhynchophorus ferrugineus TaxID=354439 RepID=A0A834HIF3_RHYFE|nr:hypothetical protein GWI33_003805 [Rhynchophorus ferrugineus]